MRQYFEIYNPTKTYMYPNLQIATPEMIQAEYAAVNLVTCVIGTDASHNMFASIEPISIMKARLGIDSTLTDEEAILVIEEIVNIPTVTDINPTAEERIAAALEFQNVLALSEA